MKIEKIIENQYFLNIQLADIMKENGIYKIRLTSFGNSIASGYSMVRITKPLLLRNESLEQIMLDRGIVLDIHHFARAQNNNDERLYEWLITNIKESEIHRMNQNDYSDSKIKMSTHGLNQEMLDKLYPLNIKYDNGLQDTILESDEEMANIVIYNGCTGSFLDNITRSGKLSHKFTYGIKRDLTSLGAILKFIQNSNRNSNTNTQVYICGAPNFLGLNISNFINIKLKKIADDYANTTYVEPVKSKFLYQKYELDKITDIEQNQKFIKKIKFLQPDIHYDEIEYLKFNNNIIEAINKNYLINQSMINIDRNFAKFSSDLELNSQDLIKQNNYIQYYINSIIKNQSIKLTEYQKKEFLNKLKKYIENRIPYDFHYVGKDNFKNSFDSKYKHKCN